MQPELARRVQRACVAHDEASAPAVPASRDLDQTRARIDARVARAARSDVWREHTLASARVEQLLARLKVQQFQAGRGRRLGSCH